jgi:hypothetical protein
MSAQVNFRNYQQILSDRGWVESEHLSDPFQFSYGNVTLEEYSDSYRSAHWQGRKIWAIPQALWTGVVMTTYHLGRGILLDLPRACFGNTDALKISAFKVARYLEQFLGWLITLFNDRVGSYLIVDGLFHVEFYSKIRTTTFQYTEINGVHVPHAVEASKITLLDFRDMGDNDKDVIDRFQLHGDIADYGSDFYGRLAEANEEILASLNLIDLKMGIESPVIYALMRDDDIREITVPFARNLSSSQVRVLRQRIAMLENVADYQGEMDNMPLAYLYHHFPAERVNQVPRDALRFISDSSIKKIDWSEATKQMVDNIFRHDDLSRLALLSAEQLQFILPFLERYQCNGITDEQFLWLDYFCLSADQISKVVDADSYDKQKRRFAKFAPYQVEVMLPKLRPDQCNLITDEQFKEMDLTEMTAEQLSEMFWRHSFEVVDEEMKQRRSQVVNGVVTTGLPADEVRATCQEREIKNRDRLIILSTAQRAQIRDKLSQECQEIIDQLDGVK